MDLDSVYRVRCQRPVLLSNVVCYSLSEKIAEDPPAKLLDDLFRKTKAAPCIYWLPLTDEQVMKQTTSYLLGVLFFVF